MPWETKTLKVLDNVYDNNDALKQSWSVTRKVNEADGKKYARDLCRTVYYIKDGEPKSFPVTLTMADFNWILANKDAIKAELAPTPKAAPAKPASTPTSMEEIEEVPF